MKTYYVILHLVLLGFTVAGQINRGIENDLPEFMLNEVSEDSILTICMCFDRNEVQIKPQLDGTIKHIDKCIILKTKIKSGSYHTDYKRFVQYYPDFVQIQQYSKLDSLVWIKQKIEAGEIESNYEVRMTEELIKTDNHVDVLI